ncbi:Crp/Fnr family transcriptional regulator [Bradyrhizobium jicamae]|uniref:Crp/Fnr family transcriptional regulator n=1 Tax=Bradyrhizobium jicamae TaxID=280332 RepID=A0ABS5FQ63_9BRAD|nr:Crp/Fnr family transcriptional regulator [Bradyrhizobium jicamae]MBR0798914.1 Crp/Fnr family transcriptional regulator [Bradyrhizobium jicamae]MBR0938612.1 Crp/Fnr family transcriptional regulator [Bradyrhizobium jicamae]
MHSPALEGNLAQPVIRRLDALRQLSERGIALLQRAILEGLQRAGQGEDLANEGDPVDSVRIILSGWLCRFKTLEDGRRQITSFILPGDACDACVYLLSVMDHSIGTLTPVIYADIKRPVFERLLAADQSLAQAFWCETMVNSAIQREWTVNIGRRIALERVAHLLCEIHERLRPVGMIDGDSCAFPVTQIDLADATGLSVVHVNRTLQELRASRLITLRDRTLTIMDLRGLQNIALFTADYLHTKRCG